MSHTPGPWESRCVGSGGAPDNPEDMYEVVTVAAGPRICEYVWEADARLIAAAPDLLEMLCSLAGQAELVAGLPTCGEREVLNGIARQARAAIAKATGADK